MANEPYVPIDEVARHFSVSVSTIRTWVKQNRITRDTYIQVGNTYRFQLSAVVAALSAANDTEETTRPDAVSDDLPELVTGDEEPAEEDLFGDLDEDL